MAKYNFDIVINNNAKICGGYLTTIHGVTKIQAAKEMERIGRELIKNTPGIDYVSYSAYNADDEDDLDNTVYVHLSKIGRKVDVYTDARI